MTNRILIVDDDPDIVRVIEVNLSLEGFDLITAADGEHALERAIDWHPDLILLDVMMPKIDGFEVCRRLRDDPRTTNLSVIMLTAKAMSADKVVGLTAGADDYIVKPFDPRELVARVKSTLLRSRQMRDRNPLSGLPGNTAIGHQLAEHVSSKGPFALMHVDLDNFKAFNDFYGFMRGDEAIKLTAGVLIEVARNEKTGQPVFVGHIGGDDFVVICHPDQMESLAGNIISAFDSQIGALFDEADRARGYIEIADRHDQMRKFPLMTISLGIASSVNRAFESHIEASQVATDMKHFAKRDPTSSFAVDRRRNE